MAGRRNIKPVLVGYTNLTHEPDAEVPQRRQKLELTGNDFITHLHGVGATRSGKSKWLELFCRGLVRQKVGFTLIDPQGALAEALITYLAYRKPFQRVIYFDPSRTDYLVPFNPFTQKGGDIAVQVSRQIQATLRVWGASSLQETPRLGRVMRVCYHLFSTGKITLNELHELLLWDYKELREYAGHLLPEGSVPRNEWMDLTGYKKKQEFDTQMESTRNRLAPFVDFPQIRRIMSVDEPNLNFEEIFDEGTILIANLRQSDYFAEENAKLIGTLIIHELWQAVRRRGAPPRRPYFLLIDEFQKFLTPDIREILDRGAGKGLHLGIFHQHLTQLQEQDQWTYDSVMGNAKTKIVFGGLTKPNARIMVDEMFVNQIPYDEIKFFIEQTKFWPVYMRDKVISRAHGVGTGSATGASAGTGLVWNPAFEEWVPSEGSSDFGGTSESETWSEGESDIPIFYPVPFIEALPGPTYTLEEQNNRLADRLMAQYQRHYFIKRPGQPTIPAVTPFVEDFRIFPENEEAYILEHCIKPYGLLVEEIDEKLKKKKRRLLEEARKPPQLDESVSWDE